MDLIDRQLVVELQLYRSKMQLHRFYLAVFSSLFVAGHHQVAGFWTKNAQCPTMCTCRLEHASESPIHRFTTQDSKTERPHVEAIVLETNDVYYDEDFLSDSSYIRSAICVVQSDMSIQNLIEELPKDLNALTLLQAPESGNKSMDLSTFATFPDLKILELQSAQITQPHTTQRISNFFLNIDTALEKLEYFNLERIIITNSKERTEILSNNDIIYEFVQKNDEGHQITFLEKSGNKILPYKTYVENLKGEEGPIFNGFTNLQLLRIYESEIHHIHREMFAGLNNLHTLILQKNKLQFIAEFGFYGTPNLRSLSLAYNNLLNIQITDLAGLLELEYLDLSCNNFTQLSELSLPPFPKLKLANFANNPITVVFPNTFEILNTTYSLIVGGLDEPLILQTNSFVGLNLLVSLKLLHLNIPLFERDILRGMRNLQVLQMTGNIDELQYDAFLEVQNLDTLILANCNLSKVSVDSFIGLEKLRILDLSKNSLEALPPGIFDVVPNIGELYLHQNHFTTLPQHLFAHLSARLIRLNENPWHCSCDMSDWKPMITNRIKQKTIRSCDGALDKGLACQHENKVYYKYVYENAVSPKCATPAKYLNWSVFQVMKQQFKCVDFKPKMKRRPALKRLPSVQMHKHGVERKQEIEEKLEENATDSTISTNHDVDNATISLITSTAHEDFAVDTDLQEQKLKLERKYQREMKMKKYLAKQGSNSSQNLKIRPIDNNENDNSL